jgi:hypothetical protein
VKNLRPDDKVDRMAWFDPEDDWSGAIRNFRIAMSALLLVEVTAVIATLIAVGLTR